MRLPRLILAALIVSAVALAPVAGAFAAAAGALPAHAKVAVKVAMKSCHEKAVPPAHTRLPKGSHCPNCGIDGSCNAACLLKCFQLSATLEPAIVMLGFVSEHLPMTIASEPPGWSAKPPAPPPRA
jgi:hypothetical protein